MSNPTVTADATPDDDVDLRLATAACKRALSRLVTISDVAANQLSNEGILEHGTGTVGLRTRPTHQMPARGSRSTGSRVPVGVDTHGTIRPSTGTAPSKARSLYDHYLWRMRRALETGDHGTALRLAGEATIDYERHVGKRQALRFADHDQAVEFLLASFNGVSAETAALEMRTPSESFSSAVKWVRQQRVRNGREGETGEPARRQDDRTRRIWAMAASGATQRVIAEEFGLTQGRVSQILKAA